MVFAIPLFAIKNISFAISLTDKVGSCKANRIPRERYFQVNFSKIPLAIVVTQDRFTIVN